MRTAANEVVEHDDVEPRGALESFARWERQQWSLFDLDVSADRPAWQALPAFVAEQLRVGIDRFFLGEMAVTETLTPLAHAAPTAEERFFLCAQLADEARHTLFFLRYLTAVGDGASPEVDGRGVAGFVRERWDATPDYFSELLDQERDHALSPRRRGAARGQRAPGPARLVGTLRGAGDAPRGPPERRP
jgi:hypothetical protein